jgi:hypothetical protein
VACIVEVEGTLFTLQEWQAAYIPVMRDIAEGMRVGEGSAMDTIPIMGCSADTFRLVLQYVAVAQEFPFRAIRAPLVGSGLNLHLSGVPRPVGDFMWQRVGLRAVQALHEAAQTLRMSMLENLCVAFLAACIMASYPVSSHVDQAAFAASPAMAALRAPLHDPDLRHAMLAQRFAVSGPDGPGGILPEASGSAAGAGVGASAWLSSRRPVTIKDPFPYAAWKVSGLDDGVAMVDPADIEAFTDKADMPTVCYYACPTPQQQEVLQRQLRRFFPVAAKVPAGLRSQVLRFMPWQTYFGPALTRGFELTGASAEDEDDGAKAPVETADDCWFSGFTQDVMHRTVEHVAAGRPLDAVDDAGNTLLHYAAAAGDVVAVHALMRRRVAGTMQLVFTARSELRNRAGQTPMHLAVQAGSVATVRALQYTDCMAAQDGTGVTPLEAAVAAGSAECVAALCVLGVNTEHRNAVTDVCALWLAASRGDSAVMQALLDGGADVHVKGPAPESQPCLHAALESPNPASASVLLNCPGVSARLPRRLWAVMEMHGFLRGPVPPGIRLEALVL